MDKLQARSKLVARSRASLGQQQDETRRNPTRFKKNKSAEALRSKLTQRLAEVATRIDDLTSKIVELDAKLAELRVQFKETLRDVKFVVPVTESSCSCPVVGLNLRPPGGKLQSRSACNVFGASPVMRPSPLRSRATRAASDGARRRENGYLRILVAELFAQFERRIPRFLRGVQQRRLHILLFDRPQRIAMHPNHIQHGLAVARIAAKRSHALRDACRLRV